MKVFFLTSVTALLLIVFTSLQYPQTFQKAPFITWVQDDSLVLEKTPPFNKKLLVGEWVHYSTVDVSDISGERPKEYVFPPDMRGNLYIDSNYRYYKIDYYLSGGGKYSQTERGCIYADTHYSYDQLEDINNLTAHWNDWPIAKKQRILKRIGPKQIGVQLSNNCNKTIQYRDFITQLNDIILVVCFNYGIVTIPDFYLKRKGD